MSVDLEGSEAYDLLIAFKQILTPPNQAIHSRVHFRTVNIITVRNRAVKIFVSFLN